VHGFARRITIAGLFAVPFVIGTAQRAHAQAALLGPGAAYIGGGISGIATSDLDDRLEAGGYPTFGKSATTLGIGAYRLLSNRVMLGFEGTGLIIGEEGYPGGEVGIGGGYATLGLGYAIQLSPRARVFPRIGFGAGGMGVWFDSEEDTVAFDDVLANPAPAPDTEEPVLSIDGIVIDAGGGVEFTPMRRGSGLLIGLRFGYLFAPFDTNWDFIRGRNSSDVTGGPEASISGLYLRVVVGGAWRR
jgi:hypothetical protein